MPDPRFDEALRTCYVRFDLPADEIVRRPTFAERFCQVVRAECPSATEMGDEEITSRLIQLRKRGQGHGGLPRIRK